MKRLLANLETADDPWEADTRRERANQLSFEGESFNASLEERLMDCTREMIVEIRNLKEGISENKRLLEEIASSLKTIALTCGIIFWTAVAYGIYRVAVN